VQSWARSTIWRELRKNNHGLKRYERLHPMIQIIRGSDLGTAGLSNPGIR